MMGTGLGRDTLNLGNGDQRQVAHEKKEQSHEQAHGADVGKDVHPSGAVVTPTGRQKVAMQRCDHDDEPLKPHANVDENGFSNNKFLDEVYRIADEENSEVVPVCNKIEAEIAELDAEEREEFLADLGLQEPGLNRVIRAGYKLLSLYSYFTAGPKEARSWTIPIGALAP